MYDTTMFYIKLSPKDDIANQISILYSYFNLIMKMLIICTIALKCEQTTISDYVFIKFSQKDDLAKQIYIIFISF